MVAEEEVEDRREALEEAMAAEDQWNEDEEASAAPEEAVVEADHLEEAEEAAAVVAEEEVTVAAVPEEAVATAVEVAAVDTAAAEDPIKILGKDRIRSIPCIVSDLFETILILKKPLP